MADTENSIATTRRNLIASIGAIAAAALVPIGGFAATAQSVVEPLSPVSAVNPIERITQAARLIRGAEAIGARLSVHSDGMFGIGFGDGAMPPIELMRAETADKDLRLEIIRQTLLKQGGAGYDGQEVPEGLLRAIWQLDTGGFVPLEAIGDRLEPIYRRGDHFWYDPGVPARDDRLAVIFLKAGQDQPRGIVKHLVATRDDDIVVKWLGQGETTIARSEVHSMHRVINDGSLLRAVSKTPGIPFWLIDDVRSELPDSVSVWS
jgi:hypothetical protein